MTSSTARTGVTSHRYSHCCDNSKNNLPENTFYAQFNARHIRDLESLFKCNERSEYSYIGLTHFFFQEKVLKFVHAQF